MLSHTESAQFIAQVDEQYGRLDNFYSADEVIALISLDSRRTADNTFIEQLRVDLANIEARLAKERQVRLDYRVPSPRLTTQGSDFNHKSPESSQLASKLNLNFAVSPQLVSPLAATKSAALFPISRNI